MLHMVSFLVFCGFFKSSCGIFTKNPATAKDRYVFLRVSQRVRRRLMSVGDSP